jgi:hypothetical protein
MCLEISLLYYNNYEFSYLITPMTLLYCEAKSLGKARNIYMYVLSISELSILF